MPKQNTRLESIAKILIIDGDGNVLTLTLSEHLKYPEKSYQPDLPGGGRAGAFGGDPRGTGRMRNRLRSSKNTISVRRDCIR